MLKTSLFVVGGVLVASGLVLAGYYLSQRKAGKSHDEVVAAVLQACKDLPAEVKAEVVAKLAQLRNKLSKEEKAEPQAV